MKIHEIITEETWCQNVSSAPNGSRCANGWIFKIYGHPDKPLELTYNEINAQVRLRAAVGNSIISSWNDAPERTFAEIKAAFQKADL